MLHSPHSFKLFDQCRKKYWHERVAKDVEPGPPSEAARKGLEVHRRAELLLTEGLPIHEPELQWLVRRIEQVQAFSGEIHSELGLGLDRSLRPCSYEDGWIRGRADLVAFSMNRREALIVDFKTGKRRTPVDWTQLDFYALVVLLENEAVERVKICYDWTGKERTDSTVRVRADAARLKARFEGKARKAEAEKEWRPSPSLLCEAWCPVVECKFHGANEAGGLQ